MEGWRPTGPLEAHPRSILIVLLSAVGDAVQVLPVATALRRAFPTTRITWVLQPAPQSLVQGHPSIDEFVPFHWVSTDRSPRGILSGIRSVGRGAEALRAAARRQPDGCFDLLLDLQVYLKAGLLTAITPARVKLGFDWRRTRDLNWVLTTHSIPRAPVGHIQDQYFEFLHHIGVQTEPLEYGLTLSEREKEDQRDFFFGLDGPGCSLVVASSDPRKNWNPQGYAIVARRLREEFGMQPILVGGNSPREADMARAIRAEVGDGVLDARGGGLRRLLWLLAGSALVISPDTGPLHMARAMDVPVIGLFGSTNPKRSGPYRRFTDLVVDGYARFPGEEYAASRERRKGGMGRITPDMVMEKVERAMGAPGGQKRLNPLRLPPRRPLPPDGPDRGSRPGE